MEIVRNFISGFRRRSLRLRARRRRTRRSIRLTTVHPLLSNRETEPYKYAIQQLARYHLTPESTSTTDDKIEGGADTTDYTGERYLPSLVSMLKDADTSQNNLKLQIIKSLGEICCGVKDNQDRAREEELIPIIVDYMTEMEEDEETRKWCLHTLFFLLCNNSENQAEAQQNPKFKLCVLQGLEDNWKNWDHNEAAELEAMASLAPQIEQQQQQQQNDVEEDK